MTKLRMGYCNVCDAVQIWYRDEKTGQLIFTDQYAEFSIALSNNTIARHSVCKGCIVTLDDQKVQSLFERIKESWRDQYVGWASQSQFDQLESLTLIGWDSGPTADAIVTKKIKDHKQKQHEDRVKESHKKDKKHI